MSGFARRLQQGAAVVTAPSGSSSFPTAGTTGITGVGINPGQLTASGSIKVQTNNVVLDHLDITGTVQVYSGVTGTVIKNCRITTSGGTYCVDCQYTGSAGAVTIQDCQIISTSTTDTAACINLSGGSYVLRCDISGSKQSINGSLSGTTITDNYMHDIVNVSGSAHCENIYTAGTSGGTLIQHNTLLNPLNQTACIFMDGKYGPFSDTTINNNLMAGGGYCIYGGNGATITNVAITNNVYSRTGQTTQPYPAYWAKGGYYGPTAYIDANETYAGNTWADDGSPA